MLHTTTFGLQPEDSCLWLCRLAVLVLSCGSATDFTCWQGGSKVHKVPLSFVAFPVCVYGYGHGHGYGYGYVYDTVYVHKQSGLKHMNFNSCLFPPHMDENTSCHGCFHLGSKIVTPHQPQHLKTGWGRRKHPNYHSACD